ncbi:MAG: single-stranded-DNA-specific exonuclease RecJ [Oscillospiraceae bacterium]|nr:single-stranded-DNA-specific exonuclease RecJ [Oscillospiraceae bacterium]
MRFEEWSVKGFDRNAAVGLCKRGINPLAAVFMCSRGMTGYDDAASFITDRPSDIHDPMLLDGISAAAERIERALAGGEKIVVYGDYDVDGMTASALMKSYLRSRGAECDVYIPGRADEGYGLNRPALEHLWSEGYGLVVTVDCGITAIEEAEYARELGLDLVITDHHECRDALPDAVAVVDPKRPDSGYPFSVLAGVGVAFKLVCALEKDRPAAELLELYGDLVALGTIADVMPVVGENRALIRAGLRKLAQNPRPGLMALMRAAGTPQADVDSAAIGFAIAPRLNAAGRMGQTELSVNILLTEDEAEAERLTHELCELNTRRRELEGSIFAEVEERMCEAAPDGPIVIFDEKWFHGVMGIVAARTAERWMFPAVMINMDEDGIGRGSCRSFGHFKMYSALQKCCDLLINYGGHEMAAGITISRDNIDEFRERISEIYREEIKTRPVSKLFIDFEVEKPRLLDIDNVKSFALLEPFGNGNLPPNMVIRGARVTFILPVGGGKHTRLKIEKNRITLDCIFFAAEADSLKIREGDEIDVAFAPHLNDFRGRRSVQLHIIDIRPHEGAKRVK